MQEWPRQSLPRSTTIEAAKQLEPFEQGSMDSLCGLYAIINALRLACHGSKPLSSRQCDALFAAGLTFLEQRGRLALASTRGIPIGLWLRVARHLCANVSSPGSRSINLAPLSASQRSRTGNFEFEVLEAIAVGVPVLISIDGPLDHYSVICGYSSTRFRLFDSYGYRWLSRQHCSFDESQPRRHMLMGWAINRTR